MHCISVSRQLKRAKQHQLLRIVCATLITSAVSIVAGPYGPPAGAPGPEAIHKDSPAVADNVVPLNGSVNPIAQLEMTSFIGRNGYVAETYYSNPHSGERLISFDWDANTNLYYSTGETNSWFGVSLYQVNGATVSNLYTDASVFSGSRVTRIGDAIYFNDGGDFANYANYFKYTPAAGTAPTNMAVASNLSGLNTRDGTDFFAAGITMSYGPSHIFYSPLNAEGGWISNPLIDLGEIGEGSGPLAFDAAGNLYYAHGSVKSGTPKIHRWTAAEVEAAIADPSGSPLTPEGHVWAAITGGFAGATGMAVDHEGNVILTATSWEEPSEVRLYRVNASGANSGMIVLLTTPGRAETVRCRDRTLYVSTSKGIFSVKPPSRGTVLKLF